MTTPRPLRVAARRPPAAAPRGAPPARQRILERSEDRLAPGMSSAGTFTSRVWQSSSRVGELRVVNEGAGSSTRSSRMGTPARNMCSIVG